MTRAEFRTILQRWCLEDARDADGIEDLKRDLEFLERELFHEYSVTAYGGHANFGARLAYWIGNLNNDADRKELYRVLAHLFFIGRGEQEAAYRTAYSKHVMQWLMRVANIDPFQNNASQMLAQELAATRFTEVTDSFGIRAFCTANQIQTEALRYKWEGNTENWDPAAFRRSVLDEDANGNVVRKNLVLLEDFVGSGSQMLDAVDLAVSLGPEVNVLLCPLFICPEGADEARNRSNAINHFDYSPVLEFDQRFFISPAPLADENPEFARIRRLLQKIHPLIQGGPQEYGPFGYRQTGGFVVPYANCPDNTVPAIHKRMEDSWRPLFLRNSRLPV
ncbi:hypothetical protein [Roseovarius sp. M141]|uniref:phosphoribosyltransferase-like protein n=1 Tax=Roseovarius sp. M141 TaxID=2583806 RepID=UPI0020CD764F|nr:hypothetical protein [Roseovarius sp. M141]MCQ0090264.1 hypothetical protein [Roseovarius sp. M141]